MPGSPVIPTRLGFVLVDDFAMMSWVALLEPFRAANALSGQRLYEWRHFSVDGRPARASNGVGIVIDSAAQGDADFAGIDILFVCAGGNPSTFEDRGLFARLRAAAARGTRIAGVSGGPYILARAGLLAGRRCTIHWEHETAFREAFPELAVEGGLYVIDGNRITCAGGIAGLDLAVELIGAAHGHALAGQVGEWYIRTQPRDGKGAQRASLAERHRVGHPGVAAALDAMEANLAEPLAREDLARIAGISLRQLERLFMAGIGRSIGQEYLALRLEASLRLLRETSLSRIEVAMATGFADVSHFARCFRSHFGTSPLAARAQARRASGHVAPPRSSGE